MLNVGRVTNTRIGCTYTFYLIYPLAVVKYNQVPGIIRYILHVSPASGTLGPYEYAHQLKIEWKPEPGTLLL